MSPLRRLHNTRLSQILTDRKHIVSSSHVGRMGAPPGCVCLQMARIVTKHTRLYTEMVVSGTLWFNPTLVDPSLRFDPVQHPVALQIGGSEPMLLAHAAALGALYGYDEINLNCGCPSQRVAAAGCFGAALMMEPELVRRGCEAMIAAVRLAGRADSCKVTVKCRLGADDMDSYEEFKAFADAVAAAGVEHLIVHSRKCWLAGLSPKDNRNVPPLRPEWVMRLAAEEGAAGRLRISINGGIRTLAESAALLSVRPDVEAIRARTTTAAAAAAVSAKAVEESADEATDGSPLAKRPATVSISPAAAVAESAAEPARNTALAFSSSSVAAAAAASEGGAAKPASRRARKRGASHSRLSALAASTATKAYHGPVLWTPADCTTLDTPPLPASHPSLAHAFPSSGSSSSSSSSVPATSGAWATHAVVPDDLPVPAVFRGGLIDSVMIGRGAYDLWRFADADRSMFGTPNPCPSRAEAISRYLDTYATAEEEHVVLSCSTLLEGLSRFKAVRTELVKPIGLLLRGVPGSAKCRQALNDGMQIHRAMVRDRISEVKSEIAHLRVAIAESEEALTSGEADAEALAAMKSRFAWLGGPGEDRGDAKSSSKTPLPPHPANLEEAVALAEVKAATGPPAGDERLRKLLNEAKPFRDMVLEALAAAEPGALEIECPSDPAAPWWDYTDKPAVLLESRVSDRVV